ncbi:iron-sulfur cluster-binding domain-containing protein [Prolixibacteraceae bacterium JC049]|nr:iron-sulfur cluster-binding domain-containing protein [Prolixibacteraceae bacterium JC049]
MSQMQNAQVVKLQKHGKYATTVTLKVDATEPIINKKSGQFINIELDIDGKSYSRSYSLHNAHKTIYPQFTVKRVKDGVVSNYIFEHLKEGDKIRISNPNGKFFINSDANKYRTHYFFAAGSGITPIFCMINDLLENEPHSAVYLFYGNQDTKQILFKDELTNNVEKYPNRFYMAHALSSSFWGASKVGGLPAFTGIIDKKKVKWLFENCPPVAQEVVYYVCGPGTMNTDISNILQELDVPESLIKMESYNPTSSVPVSSNGNGEAKLLYTLDDERWETVVPSGKTLLQTLKDDGINVPHSCQAGICGMCAAQLKKGTVKMGNNFVLTDDEIADGKILCCQSVATSPELEIEFDD